MKERKILPIQYYIPIYLAVVAVCVLLDQLTKHFVYVATESGSKTIPIIGDWLVLYWTENDGATGGLFSNLGWQNWLFFFITLIGLPVFFWLLLRSRKRSVWGQVAFAFIMGGTVGNAVDRFAFATDKFFGGAVRDFIKVEHFFGIFNIADSFLVVGVILALLAVVFFDPDSLVRMIIEEKQKKAAQIAENEGETAENTETVENTETTENTESNEND